MAVVSRRRAVLADGQVVHVPVASAARQGRAILLAGLPTFTWPTAATPGSNPQSRDSLIGVLVTASGEIVGVSNPLAGRAVAYPKVASAGGGAWHGMLIERLTTREGHEQPTDSARLWYGRFNGRTWSDVTPVATVHGAYIATEYTSDLVAVDDRLAFAYPLDAQAGSGRVQGVVLLRRDRGRWLADTLGGVIDPRYARLIPASRPGAWTVLYAAPFFDNQRLINTSLHAATWQGRWSAPAVLARASERAVVNPRLFALRSSILVTWFRRAERTDSGTAPRIEWMLVSSDGTRPLASRRAAIVGSNEYTAVALGGDSVMWFARDGLAPDRARVVAFSTDSVTDFGTLQIRNETQLGAIAHRDAGVVLITSEIGRQPTEPPAASILTVVKPVCTGG